MIHTFYREVFRVAKLFLGLFLFSVGIVMIIQSNLGYLPWDVFHQGLGLRLGITLGGAYILVSAAIIAVTVFMKESVGFGTLCNMVFVGVFIDMVQSENWIPLMRSFSSGVALMTAGLFVLSFATFLYIGAGYSAGPRDSLMVVLTKRTGKPVGLCRTGLEGAALLIGWLLGGYAGIGTVLSAFGGGIAVQIVFSILRFDVKEVHQESCRETYLRLRNAFHP